MHAEISATSEPVACENCAELLTGAYCPACGQSAHNPLRNVAHALEEFFESFWHLDGRVFRTLRDLLLPGRVACNYLKGHRVRYIAPLRLFVVLTLLTFFVGRLLVDNTVGDGTPSKAVVIDTGSSEGATAQVKSPAFRNARNESQVQATLARELAGIARAREETKEVPFVGRAMDSAEAELRAQAATRITELRRAGGPAAGTPAVVAAAVPSVGAPKRPAAAAPKPKDAENGAKVADKIARMLDSVRLRDTRKPWHETSNPGDVSWLPALGDRWFNHRLANFAANVDRLKGENSPRLIFKLMIAAVPSALFVLVPVFALLLKVLYLGSGRGYLEHLVIALYSHVFLLMTLLATFLIALLPLAEGPTVLLNLGLWMWAAIYLLMMQRRVYAQRWAVTLLKYGVIGIIYQFLIFTAVLYTVFAGLSSGS